MNESSLARWLRYLVYATAFVPLIIFSEYMSPFHFGKVIVLRSMVEVMLVLYVLLVWRDRSYLPPRHPILWGLLGFTGAFILTTITSVAPLQSFVGTLERMGGLWTFVHYIVYFVILISVMRTRAHWQSLIDVMIGVGVASAFYGFLQKTNLEFILGSGDRQRIFGTIGNPALFAGYQILVAYLAATLSFTRMVTAKRVLWYRIASGIMIFAAMSTAVRGSLLAIVVATLAFLLLASTYNKNKRAKRALLGFVAACAVFVFFALTFRDSLFVQGSPYLRRITDFSSSTFTVQTRFWAWDAGIKGWSDSPKTVLLGWGPENFNVPFSHYFNPKFFTGPGAETFFDRAHNMFVEVLVTMGLVGEITYILLFVSVFMTLASFMKQEGDVRMLGVGFVSLVIAYMIHNAFIFDTSANFLTFFMILGYIVHVSVRGIDAMPAKSASGSRPWTTGQAIGAFGLSIVALVTIFNTNVAPAVANYASTRAIIAGWQGDFTGAVKKYREAIDANTDGRYEFRHRYAQYLLEVAPQVNLKETPLFEETVLQAIDDVKRNAQENPTDYLPLLYISRLYLTLGRDDAKSPYNDIALEYDERALKISPTFVRTYYEFAQAYLNKRDPVKAFEWFAKAAELQPEVPVTYWYMGITAAQAGDMKQSVTLVETALAKGYTPSEGDMLKIIAIYLQVGDIAKVIESYKDLVALVPGKPTYWSQYAAAYAQAGKIAEAVATTREAMARFPNDTELQAEAKAFLRSLGQ